MLSCRPGAVHQFVDDDEDEVFDRQLTTSLTPPGRVLPPTSSSYRHAHRVSLAVSHLLKSGLLV